MKTLAKIISVLSTTIIVAGASIGVYFATKDIITENINTNVPSAVFTMFGDDVRVTRLDGFSSSLIEYGAEIDNGDSYFYQLHSTDGTWGSLRFAIGITDLVVSHYLYLENINADSRGVNMASSADNSDLFVGYSLTDSIDNISAGTTITYSCMEDAVIAALSDVAERSS